MADFFAYGVHRPKGYARSIYAALILFCFLFACSSGEETKQVAAKRWEKELATRDSVDKTAAIAVGDNGDDRYVYIAGTTTAFRGSNTSLEALVANQSVKKRYDASEKYSDAYVAKLSKESGKLVWVHRMQASGKYGRHQTNYYGVQYYEKEDLIYAVGQKMNSATGAYNAHLTALEAKTGKEVFSKTFSGSSGVFTRFQNIVRLGANIYVCGNDGSEGKTSRVASGEGKGGIIILKMNTAGKVAWVRKAGEERPMDRCAGIAVSQDESHVFISGTAFKKPEKAPQSKKYMGHVLAMKVNASNGDLAWNTTLPQAPTSYSNAGGLVITDNGVFVSFSRWTDTYRRSRTMLTKLSPTSGMVLFSRETCCKDVIPQLERGAFRGKGSSIAAAGLHLGDDNYLYQLLSIRVLQKTSSQTYAARVVRTSIFGDQDSADFSPDLESYQFSIMRPTGFAVSKHGGGMFAIQRSGVMTASNEEAWHAKVLEIEEFPSKLSGSSEYLPTTGKYYAKVQVKLNSVPKSVATRQKLIEATAEALRVHPSQVHLAIDPHDEGMVLAVTVYSASEVQGTNAANTYNEDIRLALARFQSSTVPQSGGSSALEKLSETKGGALKRISVPEIVATGRAEQLAEAESDGSSGSSQPSLPDTSSDQRADTESESGKNSKRKVLLIAGAVVGSILGIAVLVGVVVVTTRG